MGEVVLDKDQEDAVRLSVAEATAIAEAALGKLGFNLEEASIIAAHLVDAAMWGYEFAGLPRILAIAERPEIRKPRHPIMIVKETPVSALIDGGNHVGYVSIMKCVEVMLEKVRQSGVALVGMRNSWYGGRNAYYLEKIAHAGYAAIYLGSSSPTVVPSGAAKKALGTNPLSIALPGKTNPYIYDIGTSSVMSGEILLKSLLGQSFEEEMGIDKEGKPTRVACELKEGGGVFAFGGHKGYGLSLTIQALGLLAGAKMRAGDVADFGFLYIAFDPNLLMPTEQFIEELEELLARVRNLPRQSGVSEIRIPSERGFQEREIRRRQGILVNKDILERLQRVGD